MILRWRRPFPGPVFWAKLAKRRFGQRRFHAWLKGELGMQPEQLPVCGKMRTIGSSEPPLGPNKHRREKQPRNACVYCVERLSRWVQGEEGVLKVNMKETKVSKGELAKFEAEMPVVSTENRKVRHHG